MAPRGILNFKGRARAAAPTIMALSRCNMTIDEIAKMLKLSWSSVQRCLACGGEPKARAKRAPAPSRKKKISLLKKMLKETKDGSQKYWSTTLQSERLKVLGVHVGVSPSQLRRDLKDTIGARSAKRPKGPKWRPEDPQRRLDACVQWLQQKNDDNLDFSKILFSDEKLFDCNEHGKNREWVLSGQRPTVLQKEKFSPRIHVWGMIGVGVKKLVMHENGSVNQHKYLDLLKQGDIKDQLSGRCFQQDGARSHTAKSVMEWFDRENVQVLSPWPPRSPDLNVIETLWARLASAVSLKHNPKTKAELETAINVEWDAIPQRDIDELCMGFEHRVTACKELKGGLLTNCSRSRKP